MSDKSIAMDWLKSIILFSFFVMCFTNIPAVLTDPIPYSFGSTVIYLGMYVSQNIFFSAVLALILFPIFYSVRPPILKILLSLPFFSLALLFSFMNAKVFAFWRLYVNSALLDMYFSKGGGSQIFEVHNAMYFWIIAVTVLFFFLALLLLLIAKWWRAESIRRPCFIFFGIVYGVVQLGFIALCHENNMRFLEYALKVPYFYDLSWVNVLQKMGAPVFPKQSNTVALQQTLSSDHRLIYPLHPLQYHVAKKPLNVLIIMVDSLRYDMINPMNMPHVFAFSRHTDQFLNNLSGGDCTRPGVFSLFYSLPSTYWHSAHTHRQESILVRAFYDNHYDFGLFASASLLSPPFNETIFANIKRLRTMTRGKNAIDRDRKITQEMDNFLNAHAQSQQPFFGFLFYDAPHAYNALTLHQPFSPIGFLNYFSINQSTSSHPLFNLYQNAVYFDDGLIEKVLQTLRHDHLSKNTVVIITADHGQEFNDDRNNYWEHASGFSKYQVRTPMLIAWPHRAPQLYHYQTTHFDLVPTLLKRVLGVSNSTSDYSVGDDFFSKKQPRDVIVGNYAYFALVTPKDSMQFHHSGLYRFTDLTMRPVHHNPLSEKEVNNMLGEMRKFYSSSSRIDNP